jgi:hypothetical protein
MKGELKGSNGSGSISLGLIEEYNSLYAGKENNPNGKLVKGGKVETV